MNKSRGRPRAGSDARERIIEAARRQFLEQGYAATTLRGIAREAGVDHALVNYYFTNKAGLFQAVMVLPKAPAQVIAASISGSTREELPLALLTGLMHTWETSEYWPRLRAMLMEATTSEQQYQLVAGYIEETLIGALEQALGGRHARQQATACAMVLAGIVLGRYVFRVPAFTALTRDEVVTFFGPAVAATLSQPSTRPRRPARPPEPPAR